jgi:hypothetical protein
MEYNKKENQYQYSGKEIPQKYQRLKPLCSWLSIFIIQSPMLSFAFTAMHHQEATFKALDVSFYIFLKIYLHLLYKCIKFELFKDILSIY